MKRINEGDYVRVSYMNWNERIARVEKILDKDPCYYNMQMYRIDKCVQHSNGHYPSHIIYDVDIVAHSPKISGVIKKGDIVNGDIVIKVTKDPFIKGQIDIFVNANEINSFGDRSVKRLLDEDIQTALTKEQYEEERYEVNR